jgi:hypothetical protein
MRFWRRQSELGNLDSELRDARPEAPDQLVHSIGERLQPPEVPFRRLRVVMVGLLTVLLLFGFAAFGGVSYAKRGVQAVVTTNGGGNNTINTNSLLGDEDDEGDEGRGDEDDEDDDEPDDDQYGEDDDDGDDDDGGGRGDDDDGDGDGANDSDD